MKKAIQAFIMFACTCLFLSAAAEPARQITWDDLIPAYLMGKDPMAGLTQDQKGMVYWMINMLEYLPERGPETEKYYKEVDEKMPALKKNGIDIDQVMAKRKEMKTAVATDLNGKQVRLAGYILPLEMAESKVTEFLLVPYVGACIHVPPPPPNQIVFVKTAAQKGYGSKQLYEPVWVSGVISIQSMVKELFLVDGSAGVDIGYTMQANQIEPYE